MGQSIQIMFYEATIKSVYEFKNYSMLKSELQKLLLKMNISSWIYPFIHFYLYII